MSRALDTLFGSQLPKLPNRIGRTEHLAGLGLVVGSKGCTRLGSPGQRGGAVRIKIGAMWHFSADAHARFVERVRAPGRPGEPQSAGGEQRRYCQEQMFCFHCFLLFDSGDDSFTFTTALCADFWELAFD